MTSTFPPRIHRRVSPQKHPQTLFIGPLATANLTTLNTLAFNRPTVAGSLLLALVTMSGVGGSFVCNDGTWTQAVQQNATSGSGAVGLFYKPNCGNGETAPTFTGSPTEFWAACLMEWTKGLTVAPLDQQAAQTSAGVLTDTVAAGAADAMTGELAIFASLWHNSPSITSFANVFNNGVFTADYQADNVLGQEHAFTLGHSLTTTNVVADSWTETITGTAPQADIMALASFKHS